MSNNAYHHMSYTASTFQILKYGLKPYSMVLRALPDFRAFNE